MGVKINPTNFLGKIVELSIKKEKSMKPKIIITGIMLFLGVYLNAQSDKAQDKKEKSKVELKYGPIPQDKATQKSMEDFRKYGLGQFIHWGLYAIPGNEWEGVSARKGAPASEWIRVWSGPTAPDNWKKTYDNLYKQFNPKDFDAKKWAKQAKESGMKYLIFTTKHHDGFALWPTKYSDYNISNSPYKKDIVKEVVDAYTAEGIDVHLYFSVLEWNNPDFMYAEPKTAEEKKKFDRFLQYTRNQLLELLENYPEIKGLWFDGTWDKSWVSSYEFTYNLEKELREKHPGLVIGSRFRADENGNRHFDTNGDLLGDYVQTWERKFPENYEALNGNDWDAIMTISPNGWGYMKDWSGLYTKSADDLIEMLMRSNSMSGNFVLNLGPDGDGNFKEEENELMKEVGDWANRNAEAIYGAYHPTVPVEDSKYGYFTQKEDNLYLSVFNRPVNNVLRIAISKKTPEVPAKASLLVDGEQLEMKRAEIGLDLDRNTYFDIYLPEEFKTNRAFVVKIALEKGSVDDFKLMDAKK